MQNASPACIAVGQFDRKNSCKTGRVTAGARPPQLASHLRRCREEIYPTDAIRLEHQINPPAEFMRDQVANQARPKPGLFWCGVWSAKFTPNDGEVIAVPSATGFCHVTDTRRHQSIMRSILPHWYDDDNFSAFKSH